jgi:hypothetical protein
MTKKKKQALDNLLNDGKISQSTYDLFNKKIDEAIAGIEKRQRALLEEVNSKVEEFEQHIKTLEMLFANFEIKHVTGEVDEEVYQREVSLLSTGLEVARQELDTAREAINQLSSSMPLPPTDTAVTQEVETEITENVEPPEPEIASEEETVSVVELGGTPEENMEEHPSEPSVEPVESNVDTFESPHEPEETPQETWQNTEEETEPTEMAAEGEETQD